jgi:hypothetical protein
MNSIKVQAKVLGLLAVALFISVRATAQPQTNVLPVPDCAFFFHFTAALQTSPTSPNAGFDNRTSGCTTWSVSYANSGFTVLSLRFESAANVAGVPGAYGAFVGTIITGVNPNTNTTGASTFFSTGPFAPWVQMKLTSVTGAGIIDGAVYGYRIPSAGPPATVAPGNVNLVQVNTHAVVEAGLNGVLAVGGPAATGAAPTDNPLLTAGLDTGGNQRPPRTDIQGSQFLSSQCSPPNGASAVFNLAGAGNTRIATGVALKQLRICHISLTTVAPEDIKLTYGTGAACAGGGGPVDLTGLYKTVTGLALDLFGSLATAAGMDLCVNQSVGQATGGVITYVIF